MTTTDIGSVTANCGACGSTEMRFDKEKSDDSKIHCAKCGAFIGTIGSFKSAAMATAKAALPEITAALKSAFKFK